MPIERYFANAGRLRLCVARALTASRPAALSVGFDAVAQWANFQSDAIGAASLSVKDQDEFAAFASRALADMEASRGRTGALYPAQMDGFLAELRAALEREAQQETDLDFVQQIAAVREAAAAYYGRALGQRVSPPAVEVIPWTREVHNLACGHQVAAEMPPSADRHVEVRFNVYAVDDEAIQTIPYLLFHELICHALAGEPSEGPPTCDIASHWSEGFMDHVAFELVRDALTGGQPGVAMRRSVGDPDGCLLYGRDYQASRYQAGSRRSSRAVAARALGRRAAFFIDSCFKELGDNRRGWDWAMRVNASTLSHDDRDDLAVALLGMARTLVADQRARLAALLEAVPPEDWPALAARLRGARLAPDSLFT
jgi:hypothetical protein